MAAVRTSTLLVCLALCTDRRPRRNGSTRGFASRPRQPIADGGSPRSLVRNQASPIPAGVPKSMKAPSPVKPSPMVSVAMATAINSANTNPSMTRSSASAPSSSSRPMPNFRAVTWIMST